LAAQILREWIPPRDQRREEGRQEDDEHDRRADERPRIAPQAQPNVAGVGAGRRSEGINRFQAYGSREAEPKVDDMKAFSDGVSRCRAGSVIGRSA
jgi:hypothetical protein